MRLLKPPATFIVFEGIDRSGKSSIIAALSKAFKWWELKHFITYEPYDAKENPKGNETRMILKGKLPNPGFVELQRDFFVPARLWHLDNKVIPALESGLIVISDRYWESTLVFGKVSGDIPYEEVLEWHSKCFYPTLTIFVDISAKESKRRHDLEVAEKGGSDGDIFDAEGVQKQARRRAAYQELVKIGHPFIPNAVTINGEQSRVAVLTDVLEAISCHLGKQIGQRPDGLETTAYNALLWSGINPEE